MPSTLLESLRRRFFKEREKSHDIPIKVEVKGLSNQFARCIPEITRRFFLTGHLLYFICSVAKQISCWTINNPGNIYSGLIVGVTAEYESLSITV